MDEISALTTVDPFDNVEPYDPAQNTDNATALNSGSVSNLQSLSVGVGSTTLHVDSSGFWLGAAMFTNAPFSVNMNGVITSKSVVSGNTITIDGGNGRILCNDGTTNRVVIGNV